MAVTVLNDGDAACKPEERKEGNPWPVQAQSQSQNSESDTGVHPRMAPQLQPAIPFIRDNCTSYSDAL